MSVGFNCRGSTRPTRFPLRQAQGRAARFLLASRYPPLLCYKRDMRSLVLVFVTCGLIVSSTAAQNDASALPTVTAFECPTYPSMAQSNRLQGMVQLQVKTDGHQIAGVKLISGHPILAPTAYENVQTWKFADHPPTTFGVTYFFVNQGKFKRDKVTKCAAKMELPTKVTVSTAF